MTITSEFFKQLAGNLPAGREDAFTALLATVNGVDPVLGQATLLFFQVESGVDLGASTSWQWEAQIVKENDEGPDAIIDMIATSPDGAVQVWFEHKVDAPMGIRRDASGAPVSQLHDYVNIARAHAAKDRCRVCLAFVTRDRAVIRDRDRLPAPDDLPVSLLHRGPDSFRWFQLRDAIGRHVIETPGGSGSVGAAFLDWWDSLAGMRLGASDGSFAPPKDKRVEDVVRYQEQWGPTIDWLDLHFGGKWRYTSKGQGVDWWPGASAWFSHLGIQRVSGLTKARWTMPAAGADEIIVRCRASLTVPGAPEAAQTGSPVTDLPSNIRYEVLPDGNRIDAGIKVGGWSPGLSLSEQGELMRHAVELLLGWIGRVAASRR